MTEDSNEIVSLLWPGKEEFRQVKQVISEDDYIVSNLELGELAKALSVDTLHTLTIGEVLANLSDDEDIIKYRLDTIEDMVNNPEIVSCLKKLLPLLDELSFISFNKHTHEILLQETASRVGELDAYVHCVTELEGVLKATEKNLKSLGLKKLYEVIKQAVDDEVFCCLRQELPSFRKGLSRISSVTLGINFNARLNPIEFTIVSINDEPFKEQTLMHRLFNKKSAGQYTGISPLVGIELTETVKYNQLVTVPNPFHVALFKELNNLTSAAAKPIAEAIKKYVRVNSRFLINLKPDFIFLLGAVKLITKIRSAGLSMCKPEVLPKEQRCCRIKGIYNVNLALNMHYKEPDIVLNDKIVTNNIDFGQEGRIFILTGPNQGGKTTYTQAVGLAQILFQLGIFVPGDTASISPVDRIYTHFPVEEKPDSRMGRLGEESKRLNDIFLRATKYSLVLLNESMQSTSPYEGLYISKEVTMALKLLGARAIFATHFHELANDLDSLNSSIPGDSKIVSLISGVIEDINNAHGIDAAKRTYIILPGVPQGTSYAKDIASRYGLSFDKLVETLKKREMY